MENVRLRNVGIVAHVDAGKTTVTEQILFRAGRIRKTGRVDDGTSQMDWLPVERERGISVISATTTFEWQDHAVNLIDTPGHVDFSSEVTRALSVLDAVIVVISCPDGVQTHTQTLWEAIRSIDLPTLFFVNKMDRIGADFTSAIQSVRKRLSPFAIPLILPLGSADTFSGLYDVLADKVIRENHVAPTDSLPAGSVHVDSWWRESLMETIADQDDVVLEKYLGEESIDPLWLRERLVSLVHSKRVFPVFCGAALHGVGIESLLNGIVRYLPPPQVEADDKVCAVPFKIQQDETMGRMTYVRVYSGEIVNRQSLVNPTRGIEEKVTQIRKMHANTHSDVGRVQAGDIAVLCGLKETKIGEILGEASRKPLLPDMPVPVFQVKASPADGGDYVQLAEALKHLEDEDPALGIVWDPDIREITVRVMGTVQMEIVQAILAERFGVQADFDRPSVIFKETPVRIGEGNVRYTRTPHWAVMRFHIEPAPRGSGVMYTSEVKPRDIKVRYQREVERRIPFALQQGPRGWEVTDLRITLVEGSDHEQHTHPLDFIAATMWGIEDGLNNCSTQLLEPILSFRIHAPSDFGGRICSDILNLRGTFDQPLFTDETVVVQGEVPASTFLEYPVQLSQITSGKASVVTTLSRYALAPPEYNDDPAHTQPRRPWVSFKTFM